MHCHLVSFQYIIQKNHQKMYCKRERKKTFFFVNKQDQLFWNHQFCEQKTFRQQYLCHIVYKQGVVVNVMNSKIHDNAAYACINSMWKLGITLSKNIINLLYTIWKKMQRFFPIFFFLIDEFDTIEPKVKYLASDTRPAAAYNHKRPKWRSAGDIVPIKYQSVVCLKSV